MANSRITDGIGSLPEPAPLVPDKDGKLGTDAIVSMNNSIVQLFRRFNGQISFGGANQSAKAGNIDGQWIIIAETPSVANTEFAIPHGLGRVPIFFFYLLDREGDLYTSQYQSWNVSNIFLRCTVASSAAVILVV